MDTALLYKLNTLLKYVKQNAPFYKNNTLVKDHIKNLEAFTSLPTTTKTQISEKTHDFLCVPENDIVEIVSTSGSTGSPLYIKMTEHDLHRLREIEKNNFEQADFGHSDIIQITTTMDSLFIAGLAYYTGLTRLRSTLIRSGAAPIPAQIKTICDLHVNALVGVPSLLIKLAPEPYLVWQTLITKIMLVGESIYEKDLTYNQLGEHLKTLYPNAELFCSYGNTEIQGAFCDCSAREGMHVNEKYFYVEILDDEGNNLPDGQIGELTVTTFEVTGMPLLRYRTGDITYKISSPCKCGKRSPRIGPILARKNHLLKIKGTTIFPASITSCLHKIKEVDDFIIIAEKSKTGVDKILIKVTLNSDIDINEIKARLKSDLKCTPDILAVSPEEIESDRQTTPSRKKLHFLDQR